MIDTDKDQVERRAALQRLPHRDDSSLRETIHPGNAKADIWIQVDSPLGLPTGLIPFPIVFPQDERFGCVCLTKRRIDRQGSISELLCLS